nr:zinc finger, CCHC-type, retrotransposon Gag domain protein [Tanacetum cinerariifolium]
MVNTHHEKALKASSFKGAESNGADNERNENRSSSDFGDLNFRSFMEEEMKILESKIRKQVGKAIKNVMPFYISQTPDNLKEVVRKELEEFRRGGMMNDFRNEMATYRDFTACDVPKFDGTLDPIACTKCISAVEDEPTQEIPDVTVGGIFLYKSSNQAFQYLEDKAMDSQIISLNEELQEIRNKYNELREGNASKNHMNDDTPMCERHESNYIRSKDYQNQDSHDSHSHQSLHDPNELTKLNNDVKNDLEDFKICIRSMRTVHWKLFARDDGKTTGVLPNKESKPINQEPQSKTDFEKSITKFFDGQRVTNIFFKNNVNDIIIKMKQNEKNFQTKIKNMERKIDEWEKSQNISSKQNDRTEPPHPQA